MPGFFKSSKIISEMIHRISKTSEELKCIGEYCLNFTKNIELKNCQHT